MDEEQRYNLMLYEVEEPWCWACGRDSTQRPSDWWAPWSMERAHLSSGRGGLHRMKDRRQVNLLCTRCHLLHGRFRIKDVNGEYLPFITNGNMVWLKEKFDPKFFDIKHLQRYWAGGVPDHAPLDRWFTIQYTALHGPNIDS